MNDQEIQQYVDKHVCVVDVKYEEPTLSLVFPDGLTFPLKVTSRLPSLLAGIRSWLSRIVEKSQELGHTKMSFCQEVGEELRLEAFGQVVCQIERPFIRASTQRVSSATMSRWAESHCMAIAIRRMAEANKPKEEPEEKKTMTDEEIEKYLENVDHVLVPHDKPSVVLRYPDGSKKALYFANSTHGYETMVAWLRALCYMAQRSSTDAFSNPYAIRLAVPSSSSEKLDLFCNNEFYRSCDHPCLDSTMDKLVGADVLSGWAYKHLLHLHGKKLVDIGSESDINEHKKLYYEKQGVAHAISAITGMPYVLQVYRVGLGDMIDEVKELVRAERIGAIVDAASVIIPGAKDSEIPKGMDEGETILYFGSKVGELLFGQWKADREKLVDFAAETFPRAEPGDFPIPKDFNEALESIRKMIQREIDHAKAEATAAERNRIREIIDQERGISILFSGEKRVKKLKRKLEDAERNMLAQRFLRDDLERIMKNIDKEQSD